MRIFNRIVRCLLLSTLALAFLIYLTGCVASVFGLMDFRMSNRQLESLMQETGHGRVGLLDTHGLETSYAMVAASVPSDVAVFYIHGSPGSLDASLDFLKDQHLQAHANQYTYDRIGYGKTRPLYPEGSLAVQAHQLADLIRAAHASKNILVGHSLGCTIAAYLAMDQPTLVDGIVLVAAPLDPALEPSSWWRPMLDFPIVRFAIPMPMHISNHELWPLKRELETCMPRWSDLRCPVTFIHGANDKLVPVENIDFGKRVMVHSARIREVILPGENHFIYWSRHDLIADEIVRMISIMNDSMN